MIWLPLVMHISRLMNKFQPHFWISFRGFDNEYGLAYKEVCLQRFLKVAENWCSTKYQCEWCRKCFGAPPLFEYNRLTRFLTQCWGNRLNLGHSRAFSYYKIIGENRNELTLGTVFRWKYPTISVKTPLNAPRFIEDLQFLSCLYLLKIGITFLSISRSSDTGSHIHSAFCLGSCWVWGTAN